MDQSIRTSVFVLAVCISSSVQHRHFSATTPVSLRVCVARNPASKTPLDSIPDRFPAKSALLRGNTELHPVRGHRCNQV